MIAATCHCGDVSLQLPRRPRVITACNCSICSRLQPMFAYYKRRAVRVVAGRGALTGYAWGSGVLRWNRCRRCGCFTHHEPARSMDPELRVGVNLRLVAPAHLQGITVNLRDGAADTWALLRRYAFDPVRGAPEASA